MKTQHSEPQKRFSLLNRLGVISLIFMLTAMLLLVLLYRQDQFNAAEEYYAEENERTLIHLTHDLKNASLPFFADLEQNRPARLEKIDALLASSLEQIDEHHILKLKIFNRDGVAVYSDHRPDIGKKSSHPEFMILAQQGQILHKMERRDVFHSNRGELHNIWIYVSYMPLMAGERQIGVIESYDDASALFARLNEKTVQIAFFVAAIFSALFFALFMVARQTERRLSSSQETIAKNEERWKFALEGAGDGVWDWSPMSDEAMFSKRYKEMLGYAEAEFPDTGEIWMAHLHPEDKERVLASLREHLTGNSPLYACEFRMRCKDGSYKHILARGKVVSFDAKGQALRMTGTHTDITKRKLAEEKMLASEAKFRAIIESSPVALALNDSNGNITYLNPTFLTTVGYTLEEIPTLADWWPRAYPDPEYRQRVANDWQRHLTEAARLNEPFAPMRVNICCKDGKVRTFMVNATSFEAGISRMHLVIMYDITAQAQAQAELQDTNALLTAVINTSPLRIFWKNRDLQYLGCNLAFVADAGKKSPEDIIGRDDYQMPWREQAELYRGDDRQVMESGIARLSYDEPQSTPDGRQIWLRTSKAPLCNADGEVIGLLGIYEDFTEYKHIENELKQSDLRFRTLFESSPDPIWIIDQNRFVECNQAAVDMLGYPDKARLINTHPSELSPEFQPDGQSSFSKAEHIMNTTIKQGVTRFEWVHTRMDGSNFFAEVTLSAIKLQDRQVIYCVWRDISARKQAEGALIESHQKMHSLLDSMAEGAFGVDNDGNTTFVNQSFLKILGYAHANEVIGRHAHNLIHHSHADGSLYPANECRMYNAFRHRLPVHVSDEVFWKKDETPLSVEYWSQPIVVEGELQGAIATFIDITERKQAEDRLRKLAQAVEQSPESIFITDTEATIEYVNESFLRNTGYRREEVIGCNPRLLQSGKTPASTFESFWRAMKNGELWKGEFYNRRKDGSDFIDFAIVTPIRQPDGQITHYVSVQEDITAKKRLSAELDRHRHHLEALVIERTNDLAIAKEAAEAASIAKSAFLANMSHEIRTPLNAVLGVAKIGLRDNRDAASTKQFRQILSSGQHLLGVINDILDFSKIEAGKMAVCNHSFQLKNLIGEVVNLMKESAREKNLPLDLTLSADLPDWVSGDALRIRQILMNLLSNAIKFTPHGRVELHVSKREGVIQFGVTDSGIGITKAQQAQLFVPFEQADNSTTRRYGGTGLGLAISRKLANIMGGEITLESAEGAGSTFSLSLPLQESAPSSETAPGEDISGQRLAGLRILAVDDVEINLLILEDLLTHEGAQIVFAEDGQQALRTVIESGPDGFDAVLMDVQMPVMDGHEATRRILKFAPDLPVIGLTAHALEEEHDKCLASGMRAHVSKPVDIEILIASILSSVRRSSDYRPNTLIDWEEIKARFSGKSAFILKLAQKAIDAHTQTPGKLRELARNRAFEELAFLAHSLKGLSGNLAAEEVHSLASSTEHLAKEKDESALVQAYDLADQFDRMIHELQDFARSST